MNNTAKDCHCQCHDGPHWLYLDYRDKKWDIDVLAQVVLNCREGSVEMARLGLEVYEDYEAQRIRTLMECVSGKSYPYSLLAPSLVVDDLEAQESVMRQEINAFLGSEA